MALLWDPELITLFVEAKTQIISEQGKDILNVWGDVPSCTLLSQKEQESEGSGRLFCDFHPGLVVKRTSIKELIEQWKLSEEDFLKSPLSLFLSFFCNLKKFCLVDILGAKPGVSLRALGLWGGIIDSAGWSAGVTTSI